MSVASWAQAGRAVDDRPMRRGVTGRREGGDVARAGSRSKAKGKAAVAL